VFHYLSRVLGFASLAVVFGCSAPLGFFSGGALEGATVAAPSDWAFSDEIDTVQLETQPDEPYSVNIWVVALDEHLYVHAGANRATWVGHMEADPRVRMQLNDSVYELVAARVTEQAEFDRFSSVYERKYGNPPRNGSVREAYLFRLAARS